jgi:hypothetical protein
VIRPVWIIVAAIVLSRPDVAKEDATQWAEVLQREAEAHDFDPFTGVAMIAKESGWHPDAISHSHEDYGLGQIRARYIGACKRDRDPVHNPSPACRKVHEQLLDAEHNIEQMAELITRNRDFCRKKTGSAKFWQWLASYQGRNYPKRNRWCQPGEQTWEVIEYRRWLIDKTRNLKPPSDEAEPEATAPATE